MSLFLGTRKGSCIYYHTYTYALSPKENKWELSPYLLDNAYSYSPRRAKDGLWNLWRDFVRDEEEGHQEWRSTMPTFGNLILMWPFSRLALKKKAACLYCSRRPTKVCCFHVGKGSKSLKSLTKRIWNTRCQVGTRPFQLLKFHSNNIVMQLIME